MSKPPLISRLKESMPVGPVVLEVDAVEVVFGGQHGLDLVDPGAVHHAHVGRDVVAELDADARSNRGRLLVGANGLGAGPVLDVRPHARDRQPVLDRLTGLVLAARTLLDRDEAVQRAGAHQAIPSRVRT